MTRTVLCILLFILPLSSCDGKVHAKKQRAPKPAVVVVAEVTNDDLSVERRYLGEVWAASDARLSVAEAGRVLRVHVAEGAQVKKGQLLIELDDRLARAELSKALASQEQTTLQSGQAGRDAERYSLMEKEDVVSTQDAQRQRSEADSLVAQKAGADAVVRARSEEVSRHRLRAPFDGTITTRAVDPGDWLEPGALALQLLTEQRLEVLVRIPAQLLDKADAIKGVRIVSHENSVSAKIASYVGALDRETRTGLLRIEAEGSPNWLRSGASVFVIISLRRSAPLNLPANAIVRGAVGTRVMRVEEKDGGFFARKVDVLVVETGGDRVIVEAEGLAPGDRVVTRGNERLRPNQAILLEGAIAPPEKK